MIRAVEVDSIWRYACSFCHQDFPKWDDAWDCWAKHPEVWATTTDPFWTEIANDLFK